MPHIAIYRNTLMLIHVPVLSCVRGTLVVLCPVHPALVCSWQEWSVGVMAVPVGINLVFTQQLLNTVAG